MLQTYGVRYYSNRTTCGTELAFVKATDEMDAEEVFKRSNKKKKVKDTFGAFPETNNACEPLTQRQYNKWIKHLQLH